MTNKRPPALEWTLACCATDSVGARFNCGRLRVALAASKAAAEHDGRIRFQRDLGFAWLDAPDDAARALICRTIHAHLVASGLPVVTVPGQVA